MGRKESDSLDHFLTTGLCCISKSKKYFQSAKQGGWVRSLLELFHWKIVTVLRDSFSWGAPYAYVMPFKSLQKNQPLISRLTPVLCSWLYKLCLYGAVLHQNAESVTQCLHVGIAWIKQWESSQLHLDQIIYLIKSYLAASYHLITETPFQCDASSSIYTEKLITLVARTFSEILLLHIYQ